MLLPIDSYQQKATLHRVTLLSIASFLFGTEESHNSIQIKFQGLEYNLRNELP